LTKIGLGAFETESSRGVSFGVFFEKEKKD
jgi:hypothetical protein